MVPAQTIHHREFRPEHDGDGNEISKSLVYRAAHGWLKQEVMRK